jgi:hypothetical protein
MHNLDICDYNSLHFLSESKLKTILKPYFNIKELRKYFRVQSPLFRRG